MNGEGPRRRRRAIGEPAQEGRLPLFPLFVVVVLVGLALGAFLSRHFNAAPPAAEQVGRALASVPPIHAQTPQRLPSTPVHDTQSPSPSPLKATPTSAPSASASSPPTPRPSLRPSPRRLALITPKPRPSLRIPAPAQLPATRRGTPASAPAVPRATPHPTQAGASAEPAGTAGAAAVAREYLLALIRGDSRTANSALGKAADGSATFAEQSFVERQSQITDVRATSNGDGTYKVEAEVTSSKGKYFVTFQVARNAAYYIIDHYAIKVQ